MTRRFISVLLILFFFCQFTAFAESGKDEMHRYYAVGPVNEGYTWALCAGANALDPWEEATTYIIDVHGNRLTDDTLTVSNRYFSEGLVTVWKNGKAGCIDKEGNVVIPFVFDDICDFINGSAVVILNEKSGLIDRNGNLLIPCEWDDISICYHSEEPLYAVRKGDKYGLMNASGQMIQPCELSYVSFDGFQDGLMLIRNEHGYGYVNEKGEIAIPCQWLAALDFKNGLARIYTGERFGYIDTTGKLLFLVPEDWRIRGNKFYYINNEKIETSFYENYSFQGGLLKVMNSKGMYGFIDTTGTPIFPFQDWQWVDDFSDGMAMIRKNEKYGFIDLTGAEVIPCVLDDAWPFYHGYALVKRSKEWQVIDHAGNTVALIGDVSVNRFLAKEGLFEIVNTAAEENLYGLLRYDGAFITDCQWSYIGWISDDYVCEVTMFCELDSNPQIGYIDGTTGEILVPCQYDQGYYSNGYFTLIRDGYLTILDREGNILF